MEDFCPLQDDVWLKGTLVVRAVSRQGGRPQPGKRVRVRACGYV
jgi:hypothetical protein